jgi:hypothetical protein
MLTCAIVIPLMAIFGGPICDLAEQLWNGKSPQTAAQAHNEAPRFESSPLPALQIPMGPNRSPAPAWPSGLSQNEGIGTSGRSPGIPTSAHLASGAPGIASASDLTSGRVATMAKTDETILASYETSTDRQSAQVVGPDEASYIQQQLRQLGAIHYVLESWGGEGNYRFSCRIASEGNPGYTRYFEATSRDGLSAMKRVLQQVEACRHRR